MVMEWINSNCSWHSIYDKRYCMTKISSIDNKRFTEIGIFLKELRVNYGYTQGMVAEEINLSRNSISKIENGGNFLFQHLLILIDHYEINLNDFFQDIE
jgi:DNA-binding XRE family transcriptional regulator